MYNDAFSDLVFLYWFAEEHNLIAGHFSTNDECLNDWTHCL